MPVERQLSRIGAMYRRGDSALIPSTEQEHKFAEDVEAFLRSQNSLKASEQASSAKVTRKTWRQRLTDMFGSGKTKHTDVSIKPEITDQLSPVPQDVIETYATQDSLNTKRQFGRAALEELVQQRDILALQALRELNDREARKARSKQRELVMKATFGYSKFATRQDTERLQSLIAAQKEDETITHKTFAIYGRAIKSPDEEKQLTLDMEYLGYRQAQLGNSPEQFLKFTNLIAKDPRIVTTLKGIFEKATTADEVGVALKMLK